MLENLFRSKNQPGFSRSRNHEQAENGITSRLKEICVNIWRLNSEHLSPDLRQDAPTVQQALQLGFVEREQNSKRLQRISDDAFKQQVQMLRPACNCSLLE